MKTFFALFLSLFLFVPTFSGYAEEVSSLQTEDQKILEVNPEIETPNPMTQKDLDDLLGPEPYLGQTSWLGSKKDNEEINKAY